jgi:hypothetical protein
VPDTLCSDFISRRCVSRNGVNHHKVSANSFIDFLICDLLYKKSFMRGLPLSLNWFNKGPIIYRGARILTLLLVIKGCLLFRSKISSSRNKAYGLVPKCQLAIFAIIETTGLFPSSSMPSLPSSNLSQSAINQIVGTYSAISDDSKWIR